MNFLEAVIRSPVFLSDGGIETRIAFETDIPLDPDMGVARLVEDERGKLALEAIYRQYLDVGRRHDLPMQVGTPTFRAGPERLRRAGLTGPDDLARIHGECVRLLTRLREGLDDYRKKVFIAGVVGPQGDAYRPEEAPGEDEAHAYHRAQAGVLAKAGVDLLYAPTIPAASEALGLAMVMAESGLPYVVSPIIDGRGRLLDGTPLAEVIARIDGLVSPRPAYYTVSCVHPSVLHEALRADGRLRRLAGDRLLGIKANASNKSPEERVALGHLDAEAPERLAGEIMALREEFGLKVLGGCCGTDHRHIEALAQRLVAELA
jgi:S-methylmethionine-dependent homocysteine/selenocysteine methylase